MVRRPSAAGTSRAGRSPSVTVSSEAAGAGKTAGYLAVHQRAGIAQAQLDRPLLVHPHRR